MQSSPGHPFLPTLAGLAARKVQPPGPRVSPISAWIVLADGLRRRAPWSSPTPYWCHVYPLGPRLIGSLIGRPQTAVRVQPGADLLAASQYTPQVTTWPLVQGWGQTVCSSIRCKLLHKPLPHQNHRSSVGREWPCEVGCSSGRLYACSTMTITRHCRHSTATPQSINRLKSASLELVKRRPAPPSPALR